MMRAPHLTRRALGLLGAGLALPSLARAQEAWPRKPIRLIVAFAPGGATDVQARLIAERLSAQLGQGVVVENRAGAAGIIGTEAVAHAAPDGYTLLQGTISTHAMNVPLYGSKLSYDPGKDFTPIVRTTTGYNLLVVHPGLDVRDVPGLIAYAKRNPGKLAYGSGGTGTSTHLAAEMFKTMTGVDLLHVPFRSTAPAATALTSGEIQLMFDTSVSSLPLAREGRVRALAVTSLQRTPALPDLPTVAETVPGFEMGTWNGLYAPPGTPRPIVDRIEAATRAVMREPELLARLATLGSEPFLAGPAEFAEFQQAEIRRWTKVVQDAHITMD
jgi:tripartite-type tricarboxylate transporter receptor subunit TctC